MKKVMDILKNAGAIFVVLYMILASNHFFSPTAVIFIDNLIMCVVFLVCMMRIVNMIEKL